MSTEVWLIALAGYAFITIVVWLFRETYELLKLRRWRAENRGPLDFRDKAAHVRNAKQTRSHTCHWPGCKQQVPPAKWGCSKHWFELPPQLRSKIWNAYRPGQEDDGKPSEEYLAVAKEVDDWVRIKQRGGQK